MFISSIGGDYSFIGSKICSLLPCHCPLLLAAPEGGCRKSLDYEWHGMVCLSVVCFALLIGSESSGLC